MKKLTGILIDVLCFRGKWFYAVAVIAFLVGGGIAIYRNASEAIETQQQRIEQAFRGI